MRAQNQNYHHHNIQNLYLKINTFVFYTQVRLEKVFGNQLQASDYDTQMTNLLASRLYY
jgi:hypothetical protein